jgi:hypothetical protein
VNLSWFLQLLIILGFLILGRGIVTVFHLPLPSSVVGMLVLFIFLLTGIMKLEWIEKASNISVKTSYIIVYSTYYKPLFIIKFSGNRPIGCFSYISCEQSLLFVRYSLRCGVV